jgi:hypothetical protein
MNKQDIIVWLDNHNITNYTINKDLTVDVDGNVDLYLTYLTSLPFKFGTVTGYFSCSANMLTSLKNCPKYVGCSFLCMYNRLTSVQYCPKYVGGGFYCKHNQITSVSELLEIYVGDDIFVDSDIEKLPEYKLLTKLRNL